MANAIYIVPIVFYIVLFAAGFSILASVLQYLLHIARDDFCSRILWQKCVRDIIFSFYGVSLFLILTFELSYPFYKTLNGQNILWEMIYIIFIPFFYYALVLGNRREKTEDIRSDSVLDKPKFFPFLILFYKQCFRFLVFYCGFCALFFSITAGLMYFDRLFINSGGYGFVLSIGIWALLYVFLIYRRVSERSHAITIVSILSIAMLMFLIPLALTSISTSPKLYRIINSKPSLQQI